MADLLWKSCGPERRNLPAYYDPSVYGNGMRSLHGGDSTAGTGQPITHRGVLVVMVRQRCILSVMVMMHFEWGTIFIYQWRMIGGKSILGEMGMAVTLRGNSQNTVHSVPKWVYGDKYRGVAGFFLSLLQ